MQNFGFGIALAISILLPNVAMQYEKVTALVLNGDDQPVLEFRQAVTNECNLNAIAVSRH